MDVIILAGGLGTRFGSMTKIKPKPMIKIIRKPFITYIINKYQSHGINNFFICLGYKGEVIKKYFINNKKYNAYHYKNPKNYLSDLKKNKIIYKNNKPNVFLIDTGLKTMTGGRLKRLENIFKNKSFMLTYGDGICDVDINKLISFHKKNNKIATVTAVRPIPRFGALDIKDIKVINFSEKSKMKEGWINGGFFVFSPKIFHYLKNDKTFLEREPLRELSKIKQLFAYKYSGFWRCMDTPRDKEELENLLKKSNYKWLKKF
tara:strand:+ start:19956 stop:20738 length:783 start_codon:yes stop_codon:yes gene_type:complete